MYPTERIILRLLGHSLATQDESRSSSRQHQTVEGLYLLLRIPTAEHSFRTKRNTWIPRLTTLLVVMPVLS